MDDTPPSSPAAKPAGYGDDDMTRASGWDALLDDLFGLNVRALATLWVSCTQPSKLFTAARDQNWLDRYTPSIRLVFSLIAVVVFLKFLWTNDASALFATSRQMFEDLALEFPGRDLDGATREYLAILLVTYPFTYFGIHALVSVFVNIWGKGTPLPVRIRLYFVTLIPVLLTGVVSTLLYAVMTVEQLNASILIVPLMVLGIYGAVLMSGLKPVYPSARRRMWRSGLGAGVMFGGDMAVSLLSSLWAVTWLYASAG
ncbi:hypothetical protein HHI_03617 [Hyphomonas hirschiana VP5]|nr:MULTISPECIES: hypothetical protein [Hyphomonas]KCZ95828.1 hypothetical protein HHI_03617 [Hyphomonas hirschiana VP5]